MPENGRINLCLAVFMTAPRSAQSPPCTFRFSNFAAFFALRLIRVGRQKSCEPTALHRVGPGRRGFFFD
jgi:hypothetical protein